VAADGSRQRPIMIHTRNLWLAERFFAIMVETTRVTSRLLATLSIRCLLPAMGRLSLQPNLQSKPAGPACAPARSQRRTARQADTAGRTAENPLLRGDRGQGS